MLSQPSPYSRLRFDRRLPIPNRSTSTGRRRNTRKASVLCTFKTITLRDHRRLVLVAAAHLPHPDAAQCFGRQVHPHRPRPGGGLLVDAISESSCLSRIARQTLRIEDEVFKSSSCIVGWMRHAGDPAESLYELRFEDLTKNQIEELRNVQNLTSAIR